MIHSQLKHWRQVPGMASHEVWALAFGWLEKVPADIGAGFYSLGQDGFVARAMEYPLKSRDQARYELHRETIDIQMSLSGGEGIELASLAELQSLGDYDPVKDVEHFETPKSGVARVENGAGWFAVLFAGEPHMPQLVIPGVSAVRKVVVKIPQRLLA